MVGALDLKFRPDIKMIRQGAGKSDLIESVRVSGALPLPNKEREGRFPPSALQEAFSYDPETGHLFHRRQKIINRFGKIAGCRIKTGYIVVGIEGEYFFAHRVAWAIFYGSWPENLIDHINGDRSDNRICNLREASTKENCRNCKRQRNNVSGHVGVHWHNGDQRWRAQITFEGKRIFLGQFVNFDDAVASYASAAKMFFGEFCHKDVGSRGRAWR